jgi:hypothetical protein
MDKKQQWTLTTCELSITHSTEGLPGDNNTAKRGLNTGVTRIHRLAAGSIGTQELIAAPTRRFARIFAANDSGFRKNNHLSLSADQVQAQYAFQLCGLTQRLCQVSHRS